MLVVLQLQTCYTSIKSCEYMTNNVANAEAHGPQAGRGPRRAPRLGPGPARSEGGKPSSSSYFSIRVFRVVLFFFNIILLLSCLNLIEIRKRFPVEQFEATVSQSTVPSPPLSRAPRTSPRLGADDATLGWVYVRSARLRASACVSVRLRAPVCACLCLRGREGRRAQRPEEERRLWRGRLIPSRRGLGGLERR